MTACAAGRRATLHRWSSRGHVLNYFNYFTEIEERFQRRRGTATLLSTLDWALIEAWREAGVPLDAVLRGIDDAFDKHDARAAKSTRRVRKVNGLAWAAQSVMDATERLKDAAVGVAVVKPERESGFEGERVAAYLRRNADELQAAAVPPPGAVAVAGIALRLRELADTAAGAKDASGNEELERTLTVLEEKLMAALQLLAKEDDMVAWREQVARELAPHRGRMQAAQIKQITQQFLNKRMLEASGMPRLSLFYMEHL